MSRIENVFHEKGTVVPNGLDLSPQLAANSDLSESSRVDGTIASPLFVIFERCGNELYLCVVRAREVLTYDVGDVDPACLLLAP